MQTLETIDKKQNLMEAEKKETTWTDKSGKKHPATQVKGDKYTGKEAEKEDKKKADEGISFTSGIAQALLREFGLEEAGGEWAPTPEQEKWLGGANRQDPYIMNRMPGVKPPVSYFKDPADQALAKQMKFPAAAAPAAAAPATATPTPGNTDPMAGGVDYSLGGGKKRTALPQTPPTGGQAAQPAEPAAPTGALPPGRNEYGDKYDDGTNAPLQEPPGAEKPAEKKKQMAPVDPGTQELQKWIASKGYNIGAAGADGRLGPNTNKALDAFMADWKAGKISEPDKQQYQQLLGGAKDTNWTKQWFAKANAASGGQAAQPAAGAKGPTVAAAQGQAPGNPLNQKPGQAAQPATNPKAAEIDAQLEKYKKYPQSNAQIIARLEKEKAALTGGQAAQPAATAPGSKPGLGSAPARTPLAQPAAAPAAGGQAAQPAGKVDLSVNNPAMNPANNAPLPTPGTAPSGQAAQPKAAPSAADDAVYQMAKAAGATGSRSSQQFTGANAKDQAFSKVQSPQQMLAQQQVDRAQAKAAAVAPDSNGSGTLQGGQAGSPAAAQKKLSPAASAMMAKDQDFEESIVAQDNAILQRIRNALFR